MDADWRPDKTGEDLNISSASSLPVVLPSSVLLCVFAVEFRKRLLDLLENHGLAREMKNLESLIFDEADQLLEMGFRPAIESILRSLKQSKVSTI